MNRSGLLAVCMVCSMLLLSGSAFSATESDPLFLESDPAAKVNLSPATIKKYPRLRFVLDKMLESVNSPSAWNLSGCTFSEKVPSTGYFVNMTVGDFLPIFRQYLTDGSLNISFRPDFKTSGRERQDKRWMVIRFMCIRLLEAITWQGNRRAIPTTSLP